MFYKLSYERGIPGQAEPAPDPAWTALLAARIFPASAGGDLLRGMFLWIADADAASPGLMIGFCQVAVLTAVAVALATRLPMVLNLSMCFLVYFLGHLTPIVTEVTQQSYALVRFFARLFETILPGLDLFDVGSAVIRDNPLDPTRYAIYTLNVVLYALTYTAIALLLGLFLFEDRDVA
jgi:ABC-type transport system involved in multi-copper enzyme maturation permease subunit